MGVQRREESKPPIPEPENPAKVLIPINRVAEVYPNHQPLNTQEARTPPKSFPPTHHQKLYFQKNKRRTGGALKIVLAVSSHRAGAKYVHQYTYDQASTNVPRETFVHTISAKGLCNLAHGLFDFRDPVGTLEDFSGLGAIGGSYYAVAFHQIDEVGSAPVADAQPALQKGSGGFAELDH